MSEELAALLMIRDYKNEDFNFVKATMLRGLYYGDSWFSLMPKDIFMQNYAPIVEALIFSPKNQVRVAALREDPDTVVGYSLLSKDCNTIHWVFVKAGEKDLSWRKKGIGRALLPTDPQYATHLTTLGRTLMSKFPHCVFNPFSL